MMAYKALPKLASLHLSDLTSYQSPHYLLHRSHTDLNATPNSRTLLLLFLLPRTLFFQIIPFLVSHTLTSFAPLLMHHLLSEANPTTYHMTEYVFTCLCGHSLSPHWNISSRRIGILV